MKKHVLLGLGLIVALVSGCSKIKQLATIEKDLPYTTQIDISVYDPLGLGVPAGGLSVPFPTIAVPTYSKEFMAANNTAANMITNVYLKTLVMQMAVPANGNFDFLDSVQLYISSKSQPERLAAYQYTLPKSSSVLNLTTNTEVNLKNYFVEDTLYFRIQAHINAAPAVASKVNMAAVFHVTANPLN